jgi:hypothetical protein
VARDTPSEGRDIVERLSALDLAPAPGARDSAPVDVQPADDVAAALELIRQAVAGLAQMQGRLYAVRGLKERFDRVRPGRTSER